MPAVVPIRLERYEDTVSICEEGLMFTRSESTRLYRWEDITNIFNWTGINVLAVIDNQGNVHCGNVFLSDSFRTFEDKINYIWKEWRNRIPLRERLTRFEYPTWCREKEKRSNLRNAIEGMLAVIMSVVIVALVLLIKTTGIRQNWPWLLFVAIAGLVFFFGSLIYLKKYFEKKVKEIFLSGYTINVMYDDQTIRSFNILGIRKFKLQNPNNIGTIILGDGTKIKHVDRVSYWPILQEYLLSKLEPSEKPENK